MNLLLAGEVPFYDDISTIQQIASNFMYMNIKYDMLEILTLLSSKGLVLLHLLRYCLSGYQPYRSCKTPTSDWFANIVKHRELTSPEKRYDEKPFNVLLQRECTVLL
jgi:hypothetical protein